MKINLLDIERKDWMKIIALMVFFVLGGFFYGIAFFFDPHFPLSWTDKVILYSGTIGSALLIVAFIIFIPILRFYKKTFKESYPFIAVIIAVIIVLSCVTILSGLSANGSIECYNMYTDHVDSLRAMYKYEYKAELNYKYNYSNDQTIQSYFRMISIIHPILNDQVNDFIPLMNNLVDTVNYSNYKNAKNAYYNVSKLNNLYVPFYTLYFEIYDEKYKNLRYIDSVSEPFDSDFSDMWGGFYFAIRDNGDNDHDEGFEVGWYTPLIEYYGEQLEFINETYNMEVKS